MEPVYTLGQIQPLGPESSLGSRSGFSRRHRFSPNGDATRGLTPDTCTEAQVFQGGWDCARSGAGPGRSEAASSVDTRLMRLGRWPAPVLLPPPATECGVGSGGEGRRWPHDESCRKASSEVRARYLFGNPAPAQLESACTIPVSRSTGSGTDVGLSQIPLRSLLAKLN